MNISFGRVRDFVYLSLMRFWRSGTANTAKNALMKGIVSVFFVVLILSLSSCQDSSQNKKTTLKTYTVTRKTLGKALYFSGTIQPIDAFPVTSPIDGFIDKHYFEYGQFVKKDALLFSLSSPKLSKDYYETVINFLKAKKDKEDNFEKFSGIKLLWKQGIISRNDYIRGQHSYDESYVNFVKARRSVEDIAGIVGQPVDEILNLLLSDQQAIWDILHRHTIVRITAPLSGILLSPTTEKSKENEGGVHEGNKVKEGQILAEVGDTSGITVHIEVSETSINDIKAGLLAKVTGPAFAQHVLHGFVKAVDINQVKTTSQRGGRLAVFPVTIEVKRLTKQEQRDIHIGMTAKVAINLPGKSALVVPIGAVRQQNDKTIVMVVDKKSSSKHAKPVVVTTGMTKLNEVVITSGLAPGDEVLVEDSRGASAR